MFTFATKLKLRSDNPCKGVTKPKGVRRTRRLSETEYAQLGTILKGNAVNPTAADIIKFLLVTGWRSGEACLLKWDELDLPRQIANLSDTKSGKSVRPLSVEAIKIIEAQPKNGEYVFVSRGKPIGNLTFHFVRLGLDKTITAHTLRHSFASLSADMGYSDNVIAGMLGHTRSSITSRYIHLEKALIEAADKVATETLRLLDH